MAIAVREVRCGFRLSSPETGRCWRRQCAGGGAAMPSGEVGSPGLLQAPIEPSGAVLSFAAEMLASEARGRLSASTLRPTLSKQLDYEGRKAT
jgi:hypothetical protein